MAAVNQALEERGIPATKDGDDLVIDKKYQPVVDIIVAAATGRTRRSPDSTRSLPMQAQSTVIQFSVQRRTGRKIWAVVCLVIVGMTVYRNTDSQKSKCALVDAASAFGVGAEVSIWDKIVCVFP